MAEEDAEIALLHQMQGNAAWDGDAEGTAHDGEQSTQNSDNEKEENFAAQNQVLRASSDVADVSFLPPQVLEASRSSSRASSARQPRAVGGFLADDSDDDEAYVPPPMVVSNDSHQPPAAGPVQSHVPQPINSATTSTVTVPKARLPHDRAGILEDRIKEDPRGDLEAWLSLISEHRKRNKLDDARAVYDRFFKVFPSAVSLPIP